MAKKTKKEEPEVSEELQQMRDVATALNDALYEDPEKEGIDVEEEDEDTLHEAIEEAAADLTPEDTDALDDDVWTWLEDEGMLDHLKKKGKGKAKKSEPEPKKGGKGKKEEPEEEEPAKVSSKKGVVPAGFANRDFSKSNKAVVYKAWKKGTTDVDKLLKVVDNAVQKGTVKSWIGQWAKGENLPSVAK